MKSELCVLVHGFTGSPAEVLPLAEALGQAGYRVTAPVLAGHEGTRDELRRATAGAWVQNIENVIDQHQKEGPIHLVGFSMGAMISAIVASKRPVASITMMAPAVYYATPRQVFHQMATYIKNHWDKAGSDVAHIQKRADQFLMAPLNSLQQFRRLVQMGKAAMPSLTLPICIIQGEKDEIVEPQSAEYVYQSVASANKELHYLPNSRHMICLDDEANQAIRSVLAFLESPAVRLTAKVSDHNKEE